MNARSCSLLRTARLLLVGSGLILAPAGLSCASAQDTPKPGARADRKDATDADLRVQKLRTRKALAAYEIARLNREIAEIAIEEYQQGTYRQDLATVEGEIALAQSDLTRCEDRLAWAKRMFDKRFVSKATFVSEQLAVEKARYTLEQAQAKRTVLTKYSAAKTIKALEVELEKARRDETIKRDEWERAVIRQADLERVLDRT